MIRVPVVDSIEPLVPAQHDGQSATANPAASLESDAPKVLHVEVDVAPATKKPEEVRQFFVILTADRVGRKLNSDSISTDRPAPQDPTDDRARQIAFRLTHPNATPPADQMEFYRQAERILHALNDLYPPGQPQVDTKFRLFYVRVFSLVRVALEKRAMEIENARKDMEQIQNDLINDEGPRIKNGHIRDLLRWGAVLSVPVFLTYVGLTHIRPESHYYAVLLQRLQVGPSTLANFMLLWLGSFIGVSLSYALRNPSFKSVDDLVRSEADLLSPVVRFAFVGTLTMLLVMLAMFKIVDLKVGLLGLSDAADKPMLAFVIGVICGISEKLLPSKIMTVTPQ